jgi:RND family efflux transporter MFP subunit
VEEEQERWWSRLIPARARRAWWLLPAAVVIALVLVSQGLIGARPKPEMAKPKPWSPTSASPRGSDLAGLPGEAADDPLLPERFSDAVEFFSPGTSGETSGAIGTPDDSQFDCIIEPSKLIEIGTPVTGVIESLFVDRGDDVERGQIVAQLESRVEKASVLLAHARSQMDGNVESRKASLVLGKQRLNRANELFAREVISPDLRDEVQTEAALARLALQQSREEQQLARLELAKARAVLERRIVRSPISGIVVERMKSPGEVVEEEAILSVAQIDPLRVEVILPAALFGTIQPGTRATIVPEYPGDRVQTAEVTVVDRLIDAASGTFGVRLELPNPEHATAGGLHCQVSFHSE